MHSHPASGYHSSFPASRLYPTPNTLSSTNGAPAGDWSAFNGMQQMIVDALIANRGFTAQAATARANEFVQFVFGAAGPVGSRSYGLYRFDNGDEANQFTGADQLNHADRLNLELGTCGS